MLFNRFTENNVILVFHKLFKHFKVFCFRAIGSGTKVEQSTRDPMVDGSKPAPEAEIIEKSIKLSQYWLTYISSSLVQTKLDRLSYNKKIFTVEEQVMLVTWGPSSRCIFAV